MYVYSIWYYAFSRWLQLDLSFYILFLQRDIYIHSIQVALVVKNLPAQCRRPKR